MKDVGVWHWYMLPASDWVSSHLDWWKEDNFCVHGLKSHVLGECVRSAACYRGLVVVCVWRMVNFCGTCDSPLFPSQTTAFVNRDVQKKMYCGRVLPSSHPLPPPLTVLGYICRKLPSHGIDLGNMRRSWYQLWTLSTELPFSWLCVWFSVVLHMGKRLFFFIVFW